jgi:prepilin-type N-terminal cleavage/methylation domain-containing protein
MLRGLGNDETGFTLIEVLIAMTVMSIAIAGIVAGFSSSILAVNRARIASTAGVLADQQMETYRQGSFASLTPALMSGAPQTGSDGNKYWVGASISWTCLVGPPNTTTSPTPPACTGTPASRAVKLVSIEVHQGLTSSGKLLFSENATFDASTG